MHVKSIDIEGNGYDLRDCSIFFELSQKFIFTIDSTVRKKIIACDTLHRLEFSVKSFAVCE